MFLTASAQEKQYRETINFNREWKYARGDFQQAEAATFNDKAWENVGLPHSFSIPYFMSKDFYVGYGWYRKSVSFSAKDLAKKLFLEFDGVFQESEIFVNGKRIKTHFGGYTGFSVDITSAAKQGINQIAVRVNNVWHPDKAPRAGEHTFSGGIYRNVRLVKKASAYIDWYGTFITTPDLEKNNGESAVVSVQTDICNHSPRTAVYRLKSEVIDAAGKVVASAESAETIKAGETRLFKQSSSPVLHPSLWHPEHPTLYKVVSTLYQGKNAIDCDETRMGFRWFRWTAHEGFFLNGKHLYLKGANVHQDYAGWGDAMTEGAMRRDVRQMKEAGFDFIRGSHYPHSPAFSRACDEEGVLFWSEAPFWGIGGFKPDGYWDSSAYPVDVAHRDGFDKSALQQLSEMIRIHRNHPAIVIWSMSNEPFFTAPETMDGVRALLKKMVDRCHELDATRPAAVGGAQRPLGKGRIDLIGDVTGYNGDGSTIPDFQNPGIPNIVAEYGSTTADRPGEYIPGWGDLEKDKGYEGRPWRSGQAIWCGFDHGSIAGSQLGKMGIVDYFRLPKRSWYWYRNEYRQVNPPVWAQPGTPARIKLDASCSAPVSADGTDDVLLTVTLLDASGKEISSSPTVTLSVVSGPGEFPTGSSIQFAADSDIRIADGKAAISFRSFYAGKTVIKASAPGLEAAEITLAFINAPAYNKEKTPAVHQRPYVRFVKETEKPVMQTFGRNNPTFASSSAANHAAGLAADGDEKTWWKPDAEDAEPTWTLDTEKGLKLETISLCFTKSPVCKYKVELSDDNKQWKDFFNNQQNFNHENPRVTIPVKGMATARFVRIRFLKSPAEETPNLTEVVVKGVVRD
ncbi:MAG: glycoside hydrolase family 2 TIM barrel-domain containing protein [Bacteroides sp.]